MHQNRFRLGLRPDPAGGAYSATADPELEYDLREAGGAWRKEAREGNAGEDRPTEREKKRKGGEGNRMEGTPCVYSNIP